MDSMIGSFIARIFIGIGIGIEIGIGKGIFIGS